MPPGNSVRRVVRWIGAGDVRRTHRPQQQPRGSLYTPTRWAGRVSVGGERRRHLRLRQSPLLRFHRVHHAQPADRGHGVNPDGGGYWTVARDGGSSPSGTRFYGSMGGTAQPTGGRHGRHPRPDAATGLSPPTAASSASVTPASSARPAPSASTSRLSAWPPPPTAGATGSWPPTAASSASATPPSRLDRCLRLNQPIVGHGRHPRRQGLLAGGLRRRHLQLRRRRLLGSTGPSVSTNPSWAWPPPPTARATGWWPPTAASSASGTPASSARRAPSSQPTGRRHGCPLRGDRAWRVTVVAGAPAIESAAMNSDPMRQVLLDAVGPRALLRHPFYRRWEAGSSGRTSWPATPSNTGTSRRHFPVSSPASSTGSPTADRGNSSRRTSTRSEPCPSPTSPCSRPSPGVSAPARSVAGGPGHGATRRSPTPDGRPLARGRHRQPRRLRMPSRRDRRLEGRRAAPPLRDRLGGHVVLEHPRCARSPPRRLVSRCADPPRRAACRCFRDGRRLPPRHGGSSSTSAKPGRGDEPPGDRVSACRPGSGRWPPRSGV